MSNPEEAGQAIEARPITDFINRDGDLGNIFADAAMLWGEANHEITEGSAWKQFLTPGNLRQALDDFRHKRNFLYALVATAGHAAQNNSLTGLPHVFRPPANFFPLLGFGYLQLDGLPIGSPARHTIQRDAAHEHLVLPTTLQSTIMGWEGMEIGAAYSATMANALREVSRKIMSDTVAIEPRSDVLVDIAYARPESGFERVGTLARGPSGPAAPSFLLLDHNVYVSKGKV